jgi:DNA-binding winged helix-turn-helix (wHTH) protein
MNATCPCCGQAVAPERVLVDLETNSLCRFGRTLRLEPAQAEILHLLAEATPRTLRDDALFIGLWGSADWPSAPDRTVSVLISRMRQACARLGIGIERVRSVGYRLQCHPAAIYTCSAPRRAPEWSDADFDRLKAMYERGDPIRDIAAALGRSESACQQKASGGGIRRRFSHAGIAA